MNDRPSSERDREQLAELLRRRRDERRLRPVSFAQRRLWFLDQLLPDGTLYNICFAFRLGGPLDVALLRDCLDAIIARHEVLRTTFEARDGEPVQKVGDAQPLGLELVELGVVPRGERLAEVRRWAHDLGSRPFDLAQGPLVRGRLLRLADDEHVLVLAIHHIAFDGWSSALLVDELAALYAAGATAHPGGAAGPTAPATPPRPSALAPLAIQYGDFAAWQRTQLDDAALKVHLDYWRGKLADAPVLDLPTDHARPPVPRHASARRSVDLGADVVAALQRLGRESGSTLFATLLAALKVLLHRYTGQVDLVVGSPIAGRNRPETEKLIGCFVNSLVLRTDLSGDPSFRQLLGRVRETVLGAFEHEDLPFEKLVEALQPERDMSRNPFFQVLYSFQGAADFQAPAGADAGAPAGALDIRALELDSGTTRLDLEVYAFSGAHGLRVMINYRTDLFEADTIERMLGHFATLLEGIAAHPDCRLSELPLLGADEARFLLETWGRSALALPAERTVHALVAAQVARTPHAVAVGMGEERLSYAALHERAVRLAARLTALGVGPGDLVGVCLQRSPGMIVAVLAVLEAGAGYVPLDPGYPADRIVFMLQDAQVRVLLTTSDLAAHLSVQDTTVLCLDAEETAAELVPAAQQAPLAQQVREAADSASSASPVAVGASAPGRRAGPEDLAYVIYTSGSTGRPKGVAVPHRTVVNLLASMRRAPGLDADDVLLAVTTLSFDISVLEIFLPLIVGARVEIAAREEAADGHALARRLAESGATFLQATPATFRMLLEAGWEGDGRLKVVLGGEAWGWDLASELLARCGPVWNGYGPTEATVYATMRQVQPGEGRVNMGGAVGNVTLHVLDAWQKPVPIGVPGELHIGGAGVALGYLNRPELTAERFVPDPFATTPGARCYRTGDKVRFRADGSIEYLGRLDQQIKLRGFRIEPGEIQDALSRHPCVADSLVVVREDRPGDQRLVAYVVTRGPELPSTAELPSIAELRDFLRDSLPEYMLPSACVRLSAFPLTPVGKIDRKALPVPDAGRAEPSAARVAPQGPVQEVLAGLWATVLGVERVSAHDDFFELGGHSLLATRLASRIRDAFEVELPLAEIFNAPTVAGLAARIDSLRSGPPVHASPALVAAPAGTPAPLSFQQQRLWFLAELDPHSAGYNMGVAYRMHGVLDAAALAGSLAALVDRHAALRCRFPSVDGRPVVVLAPELAVPLQHVDVSSLPEEQRREAADEARRAEAARPFDLAAGPLVRAVLVKLSAQEHLLLLSMHHIVSDAGSLEVLWRELSQHYTAALEGRAAQLAPLPLQYADYARWQRDLLAGPRLQAELDWWRATLAGSAPALELPTDHPRPRWQRSAGGSETLSVDGATLGALRTLGGRHGASLFMVLLAAWEVLLMRTSGVEDIVVGTPVSGRTRTEVEGLAGFFINTLVLRNDLSGGPSFRELLARVRRSTLAAFSHQDIPFEKLVEELAPPRDLGRNPIFQVFVNLIDVSDDTGLQLPGLRVEAAGGGGMEISKFDQTLYLFVAADGLAVRLNYNSDLWDGSSARETLRRFGTLLAAIAADAERPITTLPLVPPEERLQLAARRNADVVRHGFVPFAESEVEQSIGERFAAQVARSPDRLAVETPDEAWSYAEVDALARRAACALRDALDARHVAGPQRIALLLRPGGPQLSAVLGTLLGGHAYVPLDPAYPEAWLRFVLEDTGAAALLTDGRSVELARRLAGKAVVLDLDALPAADGAASAPGAPGADGAAGAVDVARPLPHVSPDALAYIRYTSGSTGRPKGVMQSHRGLLAHIRAYTNTLHIDASDRVSAFSSYTHDGGLMDLYAALLNGATLCPLSLRERTPGETVALIEALGITIYHATPSAFRHVMGAMAEGRTLPRVRLVVFGGEEPRPDDLLLYRRHFERTCWLVNGLGSTESSQALQGFLNHDSPLDRARLPVGHAIEGTQVVLLDADGRETDAFGEIGIRSDHIALGYWNNPEKTAAVFSPGPAGTGRVRQYRSGDMARRLPDGRLQWLGRKDGQVKIRGYRVEPGEVAAILGALPGVRQAAVVARPGPDGEACLVAYVVGDEARPPDVASLRIALAEHLPEHMLPRAVVALPALPVKPSGKLDREGLPEPAWSSARPMDSWRPPATATEEAVAAIYAQVLGVPAVGADDGFFALGGHSLLATQVVSRARAAFDVELPLMEIFEHPGVAALARRIEALRRRAVTSDLDAPVAAPADATPVLSFGQQRFWFLEQLQVGTAAHNMHAVWRLQGALDVEALQRALTDIVRRHDVLRTSFPAGADGEPQCRIAAPADVPLARIDLSMPDLSTPELPTPSLSTPSLSAHGPAARIDAESAREARVLELAAAESRTPFDIATGPLLRVRLVRMSEHDHVFMLTIHHMISDAWSVGIFWRELVALYSAFAAGQASPLPALLLQYTDVAAWQRTALVDERLAAQLAYWTKQLAGAPALLELPTDRPRPAVESSEGARCSRSLGPELTTALKQLALRQEATLFMVLLAGFGALLQRYTSQDDIVVGVPVAGRTRVETEALIGLFVNSLVLRTDLSGDPGFDQLLQRVRGVSLGAFAHQELPFERLVQELRPPRELSHHPVFQVQFVLQNAPRTRDPLPGLQLQVMGTERTTSPFDLTLFAWESGDRLALTAEYKTALFDAGTVEGMLAHLETLLAGAAAEPGRRLSKLPLLGEVARRQLLDQWNASGVNWPDIASVHALVEAQVRRTPDAVAVEWEGRRLTYAELDRRARQISGRLRALGIGRGSRVGLCLERSGDLVASLLGILQSGAAYVPLDPTHPAERLRFILADAEVHALVTRSGLLAGLGPEVGALATLLLDREESADAGADDARLPEVEVSREDLAYVIYTSGSTGRPKGVQVPHGAVVNFLLSMQQRPGLAPEDVFVSVTTVAFDIAVLELFGPLSVGARVVLVSAAAAADGMQLESRLAQSRATICQATPATWRLLLEAGWAGDRRLRILCGGEAWSRDLADQLLPRCGALWNMYGPTETTVWSAVQRVEAGGAPVSIGTPVANTTLHVLDASGEPLPVGVPGELCIGGAGVARGYWKRPELTAERFVPDVLQAIPAAPAQPIAQASHGAQASQGAQADHGARLYRTGDRVRRRADGTLEFLGRLDHQVKVQGFRIEPGEIESVLAAHPGVREAVVVAHAFGPGDTRLVAYVASSGEQPPTTAALQAAVRARLPEYMLPSVFVPLAALPRTPNGKLDRAALPAPERVRVRADSAATLPRSPLEKQLAAIWQDLLKIDTVSVQDNFFDLGGHSLLSMRVVARLQREAGVHLNPGELVLQTLGQVAAACERALEARDTADGAADPTAAASGTSSASGAPPREPGWLARLLGRGRRLDER